MTSGVPRVRHGLRLAATAAVLVLVATLAVVLQWRVGAASATAPAADTPPTSSAPAPSSPVVPVPDLADPDGTVGPIVALGDSLTAGVAPLDAAAVVPPEGTGPYSWYAQALAAEPRLVDAANAGVPGEPTAAMVSRFDQDVAARTPAIVVILGGTNDLDQGVAPGDAMVNLRLLAESTRGIGAVPVLGTVPPLANGVPEKRIATLNKGIRAYGRLSGTRVIDFHAVLSDDDGNWLPGYTHDGIHPTEAGAAIMGALAAATLTGD